MFGIDFFPVTGANGPVCADDPDPLMAVGEPGLMHSPDQVQR